MFNYTHQIEFVKGFMQIYLSFFDFYAYLPSFYAYSNVLCDFLYIYYACIHLGTHCFIFTQKNKRSICRVCDSAIRYLLVQCATTLAAAAHIAAPHSLYVAYGYHGRRTVLLYLVHYVLKVFALYHHYQHIMIILVSSLYVN